MGYSRHHSATSASAHGASTDGPRHGNTWSTTHPAATLFMHMGLKKEEGRRASGLPQRGGRPCLGTHRHLWRPREMYLGPARNAHRRVSFYIGISETVQLGKTSGDGAHRGRAATAILLILLAALAARWSLSARNRCRVHWHRRATDVISVRQDTSALLPPHTPCAACVVQSCLRLLLAHTHGQTSAADDGDIFAEEGDLVAPGPG